MLEIIPTTATQVTRITCPCCREKIPKVGLKKDSHIDGLTVFCHKCKSYYEVKTK